MPPLSPRKKSCLALAIAQSLNLAASQAATIEVTSNLDDSTACTLREALETTNAGSDQNNGCTIDVSDAALGADDTIVFSPAVAGETITLAGAELEITADVSINSSGDTTKISASGESRVFSINNESNVSFDNVNVTDGAAPIGAGIFIRNNSSITLNSSTVSANSATNSSNSLGAGGGIASRFSTITLNNSTIDYNRAYYGGGIYTTNSRVTLNNSTMSENGRSLGRGAGIYANENSKVYLSNSVIDRNAHGYSGGAGGGILIASNGYLSAINSSITRNYSTGGGGLGIYDNSSVILTNSNISDNGGYLGGGGIGARDSSVSLINCTVSYNGSLYGSGGGISISGGTMDLRNTTVSNNETYYASAAGISGNGIISLDNSIIANSTFVSSYLAGDGSTDCGGSITAGPDSIIADGSCDTNALAVDPLLGPLADNGGLTFTHSLLEGSPAIDAGTGANATTTDQRGFAVFGTRDIGAFEVQINEFDEDLDGVRNPNDNCPSIANPDQADFDDDGFGDVCDLDDDGDGISDAFEIGNGLDPFDASDRNADPDGDGFSNFEEFEFGSDPQVADTDNNNNGIPDSIEPPVITPSLKLLLLGEDE